MASIFESLLPGSYNGVSFLIESSTVAGGRKTVVHEFPNQDNRYVEDLGLLNETITLNVCVPTDSYFSDRDGIKSGLETKGYGTLIHPFYGMRQAACTGYSINEETSSLGYVKISMTLSVAQALNFPAGGTMSAGSVFSAVASLISSINSFTQSNFQSNTLSNRTMGVGRYKSSIIPAIDMISTVVKDAALRYVVRADPFTNPTASTTALLSSSARLAINTKPLAEFTASVTTYSANSSSYLLNPEEFTTASEDLFTKLDDITSTGQAGFDVALTVLTYEFLEPNKVAKTLVQTYRNNMKNIIKLDVFSRGFGILCKNAAAFEMHTIRDFNNIREAIDLEREKQRELVRLLDDMLDIDDVSEKLENVYATTIRYLETTSTRLPLIVSVAGRFQPLTPFTYSYYGSVDKVEYLRELNFPERIDPAFLDGATDILSESD